MPKRPRSPDEASQRLIDELQAADDLESMENRFKNELATISQLHKEDLDKIRREFKTLDHEKLKGRSSLRLKQKLEFTEGLHSDRLRAHESSKEQERAQQETADITRKKRRHIDSKLRECEEIAEIPAGECPWKIIGKNRHVQCQLKELHQGMSSDQLLTYKSLMEDLKKNGWKVFK